MTKRLFGLGALSLLAACGSTQPQAAKPLCDHEGAPACGNVGQVGRPIDHVAPPPVLKPVIAAQTDAVKISAERTLLAPRGTGGHDISVGKPLVHPVSETAMCANIPTKGGHITRCKRPNGTVYIALDDGSEYPEPPHD